MKRAAFEETNESHWRKLEETTAALDKGKPALDAHELPHLFRQVCGDLALAQHRMYGRRLCDRLNALVIAAYQHLQMAANRGGSAFVRLFAQEFPAAVRREARLVWLCIGLFCIPVAGFILAAYFEPKWIYAVLSPEMRQMMDGMYGEGTRNEFIRDRFGSNFAMFGFYIFNNVGIAFRIFAGGVIFGVLGAVALGYQGVMIGAMFGYVHQAGNLERLYTFASSHSSWELLGFMLGAAAGMRIGLAFAMPGRLTRAAAMREAGKRALPILYGSTAMISVAAVIEAFWSPSDAPPEMKYTVGILGWAMFAAYFFFAGRRADAA
jgi:uncharacterized membrane protein SpoIIM required for sporulation